MKQLKTYLHFLSLFSLFALLSACVNNSEQGIRRPDGQGASINTQGYNQNSAASSQARNNSSSINFGEQQVSSSATNNGQSADPYRSVDKDACYYCLMQAQGPQSEWTQQCHEISFACNRGAAITDDYRIIGNFEANGRSFRYPHPAREQWYVALDRQFGTYMNPNGGRHIPFQSQLLNSPNVRGQTYYCQDATEDNDCNLNANYTWIAAGADGSATYQDQGVAIPQDSYTWQVAGNRGNVGQNGSNNPCQPSQQNPCRNNVSVTPIKVNFGQIGANLKHNLAMLKGDFKNAGINLRNQGINVATNVAGGLANSGVNLAGGAVNGVAGSLGNINMNGGFAPNLNFNGLGNVNFNGFGNYSMNGARGFGANFGAQQLPCEEEYSNHPGYGLNCRKIQVCQAYPSSEGCS